MTWQSEITPLPKDIRSSIRELKLRLREKIPGIEAQFAEICQRTEASLAAARADEVRYGSAWPTVTMEAILNQSVTQETRARIKQRGCLVVKGQFPRQQALAWDQSLLDYLEQNCFDEQYRGPGDNFFGSLEASRPEIFPIYWSEAQMAARQSDAMAKVHSFLNRFWLFQSHGRQWFDPDTRILYPDRIRRRPPGTTSKGLGAHVDSGALERWLLPAYQKVYASIFNGNWQHYDPWDAAWRTEVNEYDLPGVTKCSAFRTFQGWTALSDMQRNQGLLHVVPLPEAMSYILLRPLLGDVPEDELCGVAPGKVLPVNKKWHPHLINGLCSIPPLEAGDSVWWHCDLVHAVAPVNNQQGWGNVMYIPAAPVCDKNLACEHQVASALSTGRSPDDFPAENYEVNWPSRFRP